MNSFTLLHFFLICTLINYGILLLWVAMMFTMGNAWVRWQSKMFHVAEEQIWNWMYGGIAFYKILIILFNLAPLIALHFVKW